MSEKNYFFAVARIRVREKYLLTDSDISQMAGLPDEKSVVSYLLDKGWGDAGSGEDPTKILAAEEKKVSSLMRELKVDPKIFEVLSYPQSFHNLKAGIKEICASEKSPAAFYESVSPTRAEILGILMEKDYKALPSAMQAAAEKAYDTMLKTRDGQKTDVIIDRACLDAMEEAAKKYRGSLLGEYEESTVAVTDIQIAVRALRTRKDRAFLEAALAPCQSLDVKALARTASEGEEAFYDFLADHGFGEAADALRASSAAFDRWCDNSRIRTLLPEKRNPGTSGPLVAYYLGRMNEIKTVRILITAKANHFPEEAIRERVREMYG
ncbi:MAG: V-type ATPase subunit [Lachnospiraceae bacterium]|nr:V-type ATPase subunit [Lachnospiraceae bacterium]